VSDAKYLATRAKHRKKMERGSNETWGQTGAQSRLTEIILSGRLDEPRIHDGKNRQFKRKLQSGIGKSAKTNEDREHSKRTNARKQPCLLSTHTERGINKTHQRKKMVV